MRELAAVELGTAVDDRLVEALHDHTAGMPALVRLVLAAWTADGTVRGAGCPRPGLPARRWWRRCGPRSTSSRRRRRGAGRAQRRADLDDELLAATTDLAPDRLGEAVDALRSAGLVTPSGDLRRAGGRRGGDRDGTSGGSPPVPPGWPRRCPTAGRRHPHRAAPRRRRRPGRDGRRRLWPPATTLAEAPEHAAGWYERALAAGTPAPAIAARRGRAAALGGDRGRPAPGGRRRGRPGAEDAAVPWRWWRRCCPAGVLAPVVGPPLAAAPLAGDRDAASGHCWRRSVRWPPAIRWSRRPPGTVTASRSGRPRGRVPAPDVPGPGEGRRPRRRPPAGADPGGGRAAGGRPTPAWSCRPRPAVGATVALALCELATAEHLLAGPATTTSAVYLRHHHRLGLGWVAVRSGLVGGSGGAGRGGRGHAGAEEILVAIEAGLARRWATWPGWATPGPGPRCPAAPPGRSVLAGDRGRAGHRRRPPGPVGPGGAEGRELGDVVQSLGEPPLWLLPLRWIGLGGAGHRRPGGGDPPGREVEATDRAPDWERWRRRTWVAILGGNADPRPWRGGRWPAGAGPDVGASRLTGQRPSAPPTRPSPGPAGAGP